MASASISRGNDREGERPVIPTCISFWGDAEDPATLAGVEGPFDYIVIANTIGMFEHIDGSLRLVHHLCAQSTRIIIAYYSVCGSRS